MLHGTVLSAGLLSVSSTKGSTFFSMLFFDIRNKKKAKGTRVNNVVILTDKFRASRLFFSH